MSSFFTPLFEDRHEEECRTNVAEKSKRHNPHREGTGIVRVLYHLFEAGMDTAV